MNPLPTWHNQWYYDDPFDASRWKIVTLDFNIALNQPAADNGGGIIVINWSTGNWVGQDQPPMTNEDPNNPSVVYIGRTQVDTLWLNKGDNGLYHFHQSYDLRDYGVNFNPVWISIDIAGYNFKLSSPELPGSIIHECVPEPASLSLLVLGGLALIRRRR